MGSTPTASTNSFFLKSRAQRGIATPNETTGLYIFNQLPAKQSELIGAALTGASTLMLSAILVHFRPAAAYLIATVATLLLWLAFLPLVAIINQGGSHDVFAVMLLSVVTIFSVLRLLRLVRS